MGDAAGLARAHGAIMGALVGDSVGSYLEFTTTVKPEKVELALTMPGGGHWGVSPGQVTDDGEMTLTLLRSLLATSGRYDVETVAKGYMRWAGSPPFDMGRATSTALGWAKGVPSRPVAADVAKRAATNHRSLANGHMMRSTPLGVLGHRMSPEALAKIVRQDTKLTHPADGVFYTSLVYCGAIAQLIAGADVPTVIEASLALLRRKSEKNEGAKAALAWLEDAMDDSGKKLPEFSPKIGFVRIAFTHAFYHLRRGTKYEDAVRAMLAGGGDTDTNACIVGGLLGAAHGVGGIPEAWVAKVLACDTEAKITRRRPEWLRPTARVLDEIAALYEAAPAE